MSAVAEKVNDTLDGQRVLSYRYNRDPNRLQLTASQVSSWNEFQLETERRATGGRVVLELDLEAAFRSIDRRNFCAFFEALAGGPATALLTRFVGAFGPHERGLPLVNDSLFFLGNAYLSVVDHVVEKHAPDFIRFVDDYRIFGASEESLQRSLTAIEGDLAKIRFRVNRAKVRIGTAEEYLAAVAKGKYATTSSDSSSYISAVVFDDVVEPRQLAELVARAIAEPEDRLNEGFGRLILGAIRRMRLNEELVIRKNHPGSPRQDFAGVLSSNTATVERAIDLLETYARDPNEAWRAVWLIFVMKDIKPWHAHLRARREAVGEAIATSAHTPEVVRLWAMGMQEAPDLQPERVERLHDLGYLETGAALYT